MGLKEETYCGTGTMGMHIGTMGDCIDCIGCMGCIVCMGCIGCMFGIMQLMLPAACKAQSAKHQNEMNASEQHGNFWPPSAA